ncbi:hypothetical protein GCM10028805_31570 [Spirosoma harenae]
MMHGNTEQLIHYPLISEGNYFLLHAAVFPDSGFFYDLGNPFLKTGISVIESNLYYVETIG